MKKHNNNKRSNNQNNYFSQHIRERGENFISFKNSRDLQNDALKIFRELARGQIDINKYGNYFLDPQFLNSCLQAAWNKYSYHSISQTGVDLYISQLMGKGMMPDNTVISVKEDHKRKAEAYTLIYNSLYSLGHTGDTSVLFVLVNQLQNYKYNL